MLYRTEIRKPARRLTRVVLFPNHASNDVLMATQVHSFHWSAGSWPCFFLFYIHATEKLRRMLGMAAAEANPFKPISVCPSPPHNQPKELVTVLVYHTCITIIRVVRTAREWARNGRRGGGKSRRWKEMWRNSIHRSSFNYLRIEVQPHSICFNASTRRLKFFYAFNYVLTFHSSPLSVYQIQKQVK